MKLNYLILENVFEKAENLIYFKNLFSEKSFCQFLSGLKPNLNSDELFGGTYIVKRSLDNANIGIISFGERISKNNVVATSLYYGVDSQYRGQGLGKIILDEVCEYLLTNNLVNLVIVNVDRKNQYSINTIEKCSFIYRAEYSDEEELQYHRK